MTKYLSNPQISFCAGRLAPLGTRPTEVRRPRRSRAPRARLLGVDISRPAPRSRW